MTAPLWGFPWHGLYLYGTQGVSDRLRLGGVAGPEMALDDEPFPEALAGTLSEAYGNVSGVSEVHILRVPGVPELALTPEDQAEQAALGRHWQNYTLMHSGYRYAYGARYMVHGRHAGGWVMIDAAGERWSVQQQSGTELMNGTQQQGAALNISLRLVPFGYLGVQREALTISASLADLQQNAPALASDPNITLRVWSVASHGRDLVVAVFPGSAVGTNAVPCGWLRLQLSGSGATFNVSLSVLHSRASTMGVAAAPADTQAGCSVQITFAQASETTAQPSGTEVKTGADAVAGSTWLLSIERQRALEGRILNVVFDDADQLVRLTLDQRWELHINAPPPTISGFSGVMSLGANGEDAIRLQGDITFTRAGSATYLQQWEVVLRRNGLEVDRAEWFDSKSTTWSETVGVSAVVVAPSVGEARLSAGSDVALSWDWSQTLQFSAGGEVRYQQIGTWQGGHLIPSTPTITAGGLNTDLPGIDPYSKCIHVLRRLGNHLFTCGYSLPTQEAGATPMGHTYRAVASQAIWNNPNSTTQFSAEGSYNPATHELVVTTDGSILGRPLHI